ncbi:helix-turn-helix transcriptional regulator [Paenibacillus sp. IB182496]|uniref:Helix-turn-helix transcriptional regulator n=1 Tax=Paenibacillus sabuli TaxID=2772509 RepID=A0A927BVG2_9BACL|nr:helix-turn-helix transcriptional regulator [Paenibacillus sabuli]MBD2847571.1 helix-turn-helix transcriptional regulator [Paenibacillus sabuli]
MEENTSFSKILRAFRLKKALSQEELAFRSNLDRTYISMLERGRHQPTLPTLFALAKALDIKPSAIVQLMEIEEARQAELSEDG